MRCWAISAFTSIVKQRLRRSTFGQRYLWELPNKALAPQIRCVCLTMQLYDAKLLKLREINLFFTNE
jgi:hypothetical protein